MKSEMHNKIDNWHNIKNENNVDNLKSKLANDIINSIREIVGDYFSKSKNKSDKTKLIKNNLVKYITSNFEVKPEYKIYVNGLDASIYENNRIRNAELNFDLLWCEEGNNINQYAILNTPLAVECEWSVKRKRDRDTFYGKIPFSGIKFDFQKLLLCNAELRLMIFNIQNVDLEVLYEYFETTIKNYKNLENRAQFVFIAFNNKEKTFYFTEIIK